MRRRLINRQTHLVEAGYLHDSTTAIGMHIIETKVRHHLTQRNDVRISGCVLRKIVLEDGHLLIGRRLASFAVERRSIEVAGEQIVMDPGSHRCGRASGIGTNVEATLVVLHEVVLYSKTEKLKKCLIK